MRSEVDVCAVCAWRGTCQKKFSISGKDIHCPDFVRDITIREKTEDEKDKEGKKPWLLTD
jgi:hypothetical protein